MNLSSGVISRVDNFETHLQFEGIPLIIVNKDKKIIGITHGTSLSEITLRENKHYDEWLLYDFSNNPSFFNTIISDMNDWYVETWLRNVKHSYIGREFYSDENNNIVDIQEITEIPDEYTYYT